MCVTICYISVTTVTDKLTNECDVEQINFLDMHYGLQGPKV